MDFQSFDQNPASSPSPALAAPGFFKKPVFWVIVAVVVALALIVSVWFLFSDKAPQTGEEIPPPPEILAQEIGKLLPDVPVGLVVDEDAAKISSAENSMPDPTKRLIVSSYETNLSFAQLEQKYKDFFETQEWDFINGQATPETFSMLAEATDETGVSIYAFKRGEPQVTVVMVSYYTNK